MTTIRLVLFCLWVVMVCAPIHASAQSNGKLAEILAPNPGNKACYVRIYNAAHLREHPKQRIAAITLLLRVLAYEGTARAQRSEDKVYYQFGMSMQRHSEKRTLRTAGDCRGGERISCAVDCDGGSITLERPVQGDSLLVRLGEPRGILMFSDCDGAGVWVKPGLDDKVFRLDKAEGGICAPLEKNVLGK